MANNLDTKTSVDYNFNFHDDGFWLRYKEFILKSVNKRTALDRINYAKKYCCILNSRNAQEILSLPNEKRIHVMKALSSLSKFVGCYDKWRNIITNYQLKWSNENSLDIFKNIIIDHDKSYDSMVNWLKNFIHQSNIKKEYKNILLFTTLLGLRPSEALQSLKMIKDDTPNYINRNTMLLEHFRFPHHFLRRTKKAYISIINESILDLARNSSLLNSYRSLVSGIKRDNPNYNIHTKYCRKIFATYLRNNGIEQEIIDLLQGRIPKSVFVRHYYRPELERFNKIRELLDNLYKQIIF
jgi:intergrase/recombinase